MISRLPILNVLVAAALLLVAGCASNPSPVISMPAFQATLPSFANTDLNCSRLVADGKTIVLPKDPRLTLSFKLENGAAMVSGHAAVNRYFGSFTLAGAGQITWTPLGSTRMAGSPELMKLESAFMTALPKTQRLSTTTTNGLLFHSEDGKNVVEFVR